MSTSSSLLVRLRGAVSCLVTFLIFVSSVSLLIGRRVQKSQVQLLVQHRHQQEAVTVAAAGNQESQVPWTDELKGEAARGSGEEECNLSVGRWVYDNTSQPMYFGHNCSFILGTWARWPARSMVRITPSTCTGDGSPMVAIFQGIALATLLACMFASVVHACFVSIAIFYILILGEKILRKFFI
jgi:hypothetical protein